MLRKIISFVLSFTLIASQPVFAQGVAQINLGNYLRTVGSSMAMDKFRPLHMRYFSYDAFSDNFQLLLDKGDNKDIKEAELEEKTKVLMDYFKIGLSLPNEKFWVNLRPDAQDQIIDPELEKTDIGKIMLEADLQLKKDTAGLTSPQNPEGKLYWEKLYKKAGELFGSENITIPTITRPWIVPGEIILRQGEDSAYIFKANMKVMLEQDHLKGSQVYDFKDPRMKELNEYSSQLIRELIIPKLTKEVNTSKRYAALRQVFFSLVMARWFKDTFGSSGSASVPGHPSTTLGASQSPNSSYIKLIDSGDLTSLTSKESWSKTYYFSEYKKSFEKGEYNLKEEISTPTGQVIRSYVSGGLGFQDKMSNNSYKVSGSPIKMGEDKKVSMGRRFLNSVAFAIGAVIFVGSMTGISWDIYQDIQQGRINPSRFSAEYVQRTKTALRMEKLLKDKDIRNIRYDKVCKFLETLPAIGLDRHMLYVNNDVWLSVFRPQNSEGYFGAKTGNFIKVDVIAEEQIDVIIYQDGGIKLSIPGIISAPVKIKNSELSEDELVDIIVDRIEKMLDGRFKLDTPGSDDRMPGFVYQEEEEIIFRNVKNFMKKSGIEWGKDSLKIKVPGYDKATTGWGDDVFSKSRGPYFYIRLEDGNQTELQLRDGWGNMEGKVMAILKEYRSPGKESETTIMNKLVEASLNLEKPEVSSKEQGSSPLGGIDFRAMKYLVQPMGSFKDLSFSLPTLSSSVLERINLEEELEKLRDMVKNGMVPSGMRVKEYLAACFQKGKIEEKQDDLLVCLAEIYRLAEEENLETSPELRESLVIVDTGKFVLLPNNQRVGLN